MKHLFLPAAVCLGALPLKAAIIQIDLGFDTTTVASVVTNRKTTTTGWNNSYWSGTAPTSITNLVDSTGAATTYNFAFTTNGLIGPAELSSAIAGAPSTAYDDSFYGTTTPSVATFSGLDTSMTYNFKFYSAVNRGDTTNRMSRFTIGSNFVEIQARNNNGVWTNTISGVSPDALGNIAITMSQGTGNTGSSYLVNIIHMESIPEPAVALLSAFGLIPLLRRRR